MYVYIYIHTCIHYITLRYITLHTYIYIDTYVYMCIHTYEYLCVYIYMVIFIGISWENNNNNKYIIKHNVIK